MAHVSFHRQPLFVRWDMYARGLSQCDVCSFHFVVYHLSAIEYCQFYNTFTRFTNDTQWPASRVSRIKSY